MVGIYEKSGTCSENETRWNDVVCKTERLPLPKKDLPQPRDLLSVCGKAQKYR